MVATAAGAAAVLYVLGRVLGGPLAGLAAAVLMLGSPLLNLRLVRARADSPLAFFLILALLLAVLGARRGRAGRLPLSWAIAVGAALGLGLGSKLTAALGVGAMLTWGGLVVTLAVLHGGPSHAGSRLARAWAVGRGWVLAVVVGLGVFILSDPHLYPNPPLHAFHLFQERYEDLVEQQQAFSRRALRTPLARVRFVLDGSLISGTATGDRGLPLEAVLAPLGGAALLVRAWRGWRRQGQVSADALVLLTVLVYFAGVSAAILWAVETYLVPTLLLGTLLSGLGLAAVVGQLPRLAARIADTDRLSPISPPTRLRRWARSGASESQGVIRSGVAAPGTGPPALREVEGPAISGNN